MEGLKAQPNHESASDRHRRAESRASLNESAEAERHQQQLQPAIGGDASNGSFHDLEVARVDGNVVEIHGGNHNPHNVHQARGNTIEKALSGERSRHAEDDDCYQHRRGRSS